MSGSWVHTDEQRRSALAKGNKIRVQRAGLKRKLRTDPDLELALSSFESPPAFLDTMKVYDLLRSMSGIGRERAMGLLRHCAVSPSKTLGGLSQRQRSELLVSLADARESRLSRKAKRAA